MDPVPDSLLLRKSRSAGNRTRTLAVKHLHLGKLKSVANLRYYKKRALVNYTGQRVCFRYVTGHRKLILACCKTPLWKTKKMDE
jgi:hypothetical protein